MQLKNVKLRIYKLESLLCLDVTWDEDFVSCKKESRRGGFCILFTFAQSAVKFVKHFWNWKSFGLGGKTIEPLLSYFFESTMEMAFCEYVILKAEWP